MPKVSIILPTFNRATYLDYSVCSILKQDFEDFEIIIVDNNSTDSTPTIIDKYSTDKRIRYFKNEKNIGPNSNAVRALQLVTGEFIAIFSDDDIMLQGSLRKRVAILEKFKNVVLVHSSLSTIDENNQLIKQGHWAQDIYNKFNIDTGLMSTILLKKVLLKKWNFISMPTVLIRTEVLSNNYLTINRSLKYLTDWDLWLNLSEFGDFYYINEELIHYRRHSHNETNSISSDVALSEILIMKLSYYNKYGRNQLNKKSIEDIFKQSISQVNEVYYSDNLKNRIVSKLIRISVKVKKVFFRFL